MVNLNQSTDLWISREKFSSMAKVWKKRPTWSVSEQRWQGGDSNHCVLVSQHESTVLLGFFPEPDSFLQLNVTVSVVEEDLRKG